MLQVDCVLPMTQCELPLNQGWVLITKALMIEQYLELANLNSHSRDPCSVVLSTTHGVNHL